MRLTRMLSALLVVGAFGVSDGFRCPDTNRLISVGDSTFAVRSRCRDPDDRQMRTETRTRRVFVETRRGIAIYRDESYTVEIEEWLYDFGEHRFMRQCRFENGTLRGVAELTWGSKGKS